jgi:gamma-glutamylcyclotransferase (GGCT)/AIG2-like uncharacterized protein YtfP
MTTFNLFAYGTLRSAEDASGMLAGCENVGPGTVPGILYDIDGRFPAVVLYGSEPVHGEVWRCPAELLPELDRYEGTETGLFRRVAAEVDTSHGPVACWLYAAGPAVARKLQPQRRMESGRWVGGQS